MKDLKIIVFILICLSTFEAMAQKSQSVFKLNKELKLVEDLNSLIAFEVSEVNRLYERSVYFRVKIVDFAKQLNEDAEKPLGSQNLNFLKRNTNTFMSLRNSLYWYTYKYENAMKISQSSLKRQGITELERTKVVMLSTACALILYDNYLLGVVLLELDTRVRRIANDPDEGFDVDPNQLLAVSNAANSIKNQKRIIKGIEFVDRRQEIFADITDQEYHFLRNLIYSSPSKYYLQQTKQKGFFRKKMYLSQIFIRDIVADFSNNSLNGLSKFFGNTTGMVQTRKGIMFDDSVLKAEILKELQPLDILIEKTPLRLTDKFIPGYFGHAAIWVGHAYELDSIGVWDDKVIQKYHGDVAPDGNLKSDNGKQIIEALRGGVGLSISPGLMFGSQGSMIGLNIGLSYTAGAFRVGISGNLSYGTSNITGKTGFSGVLGARAAFDNGTIYASLGTTKYYSGGTSQRTATIGVGGGGFKLHYENDFHPGVTPH